ncbi:hypothetical protein [Cyanobium sp. NIES-981]|uniref:hypothetical protein n=1 Tax=Cyanobium sp. NIES-981 TaxID=1851505 RepID=UPI000B35612A|nr:hypothetical protein [Cyanobium sp. NIES-981]
MPAEHGPGHELEQWEAQAMEAVAMEAEAAGQWLRAAAAYGRAAACSGDDYQLLANAANAYWLADRPHQALEPYRQAVQLAPHDPVVYRGLGNVYTDLQKFEAAERCYRISLQLADEAATAWNLSQLLIGLERYALGYGLAERRWQLEGADPYLDPAEAWRGEVEGDRDPLLVWSEQGYGDIFQHLRWVGSLIQRRGPTAPPLVLDVEPPLVGLLQEGLAHLRPAPLVRGKQAAAPPAEQWRGRHVSLLSLPALLAAHPSPPGACRLASDQWPALRSPGPSPRRVGLVWAAGRKLENPFTAREYWRRSLDDAALGALIAGLAELGAECVLLQFGEDSHRADPWIHRTAASLPEGADFGSTARVVAGLDLVISVDTAMAHLVGAMGRPGWVLLPFSAAPRWLRQRQDTPWYPTLRLFRQSCAGEWGEVISSVLEAFAGLMHDYGP